VWQKRFVLDREAVVLGVDGVSDFTRSTGASTTTRSSSAPSISSSRVAMIFASCRCLCKANLECLLPCRQEGICVNPFERGETGPIAEAGRRTGSRRFTGDELARGHVWMTAVECVDDKLENCLDRVALGKSPVQPRGQWRQSQTCGPR
jgi:hypothetical protein